jgi:Ran GTPase-activating protein (RanGAP) involved in mRNA processing and transport
LILPAIVSEGARWIAEAIKRNLTIEKIDLWKNRIGDKRVECIAEAIKGNSGLKEIELGNNNIGDQGAKFLAEAITENNSLKMLDLGYNSIRDRGARWLFEASKKNANVEINLRENKLGLHSRIQLNQIESLEIVWELPSEIEGMESLVNLSIQFFNH